MPNRDVTNANLEKYRGAVEVVEIREELEKFRTRWNIDRRYIARILGMPEGTIMSLFYDSKSNIVLRDTAAKIRKGIKEYDSRTCVYRKIHKEEASKWLMNIKERHQLETWNEVAEVVDYPITKIWQIRSPASQKRFVHINDMRHMMIAYNEWVKERAARWKWEGVAS